jgi:hypothetical protein
MKLQDHAAELNKRVQTARAAKEAAFGSWKENDTIGCKLLYYNFMGVEKAARWCAAKVAKAAAAKGGLGIEQAEYQASKIKNIELELKGKIRKLEDVFGKIILTRNEDRFDKEFKQQQVTFYECELRELATIKL